MKLHVLSDLHLEFEDFAPPATEPDVVVLAGDIGSGTDGVAWAAHRFPDRPVVYVPGNHEYYGRDIGFVEELCAAAPVLPTNSAVILALRPCGVTSSVPWRANANRPTTQIAKSAAC